VQVVAVNVAAVSNQGNHKTAEGQDKSFANHKHATTTEHMTANSMSVKEEITSKNVDRERN